MMKRVAVLGSTGSIGTNALDVMAALPDRFEVVSLSGGRNADLLCSQAERFRPRRVCVGQGAVAVRDRLASLGIEVLEGEAGLIDLAQDGDVDLVVNGLVAGVGIRPTVAAVRSGKDVATANKETLVVAGHLVTELARKHGGTLVPLDSELTPIWQTLDLHSNRDVRKIILPASGGPFFASSVDEMASVTPAQALNHPTWKMGPKITIDSATLMNKGFEVIESHWFFDLPAEKIDVVIHRQSIIHCLVEFIDGGLIAHLSSTDMRLPIQQALTHPDKLPSRVKPLDLVEVGSLSFHAPDTARFPCLRLCYDALSAGGTAPAVLNAANEIGVAAFLEGRIGFLSIPNVVEATLDAHDRQPGDTLDAIYEMDHWAREKAGLVVEGLAGNGQ
jgi:1-deoxy-D-xylulose-5-phosphate reductoisomerase